MLQQPIIEIANRTWLISEYRLVNYYLLEGVRTALLIDCGAGIGNAAKVAQELTDKPLTVAITHGHMDHDGGAALFPYILEHADDFPISIHGYQDGGEKARREYAVSRGAVRNPEASIEELLALVQPNGVVNRRPLEPGHIFDLGGRSIEVIHTPGHSLGSVCFLDREQRLLFTGDMANNTLLLNFGEWCATVEVYNESMRRVWARESEFDALCLGHDALETVDKTIIQDYIEATDLLLRGEAVGEALATALHSGVCFKHKRAVVFYDPARLR